MDLTRSHWPPHTHTSSPPVCPAVVLFHYILDPTNKATDCSIMKTVNCSLSVKAEPANQEQSNIFPPRSLLRSKMRHDLITFISVQRCDGERDLSYGEMPFCTTRWCSWLFLLLQMGLWGAVVHVILFIPVTSPGWTPALITGYSVLACGPSKSSLWWQRIYSDSVFWSGAEISIERPYIK